MWTAANIPLSSTSTIQTKMTRSLHNRAALAVACFYTAALALNPTAVDSVRRQLSGDRRFAICRILTAISSGESMKLTQPLLIAL